MDMEETSGLAMSGRKNPKSNDKFEIYGATMYKKTSPSRPKKHRSREHNFQN